MIKNKKGFCIKPIPEESWLKKYSYKILWKDIFNEEYNYASNFKNWYAIVKNEWLWYNIIDADGNYRLQE